MKNGHKCVYRLLLGPVLFVVAFNHELHGQIEGAAQQAHVLLLAGQHGLVCTSATEWSGAKPLAAITARRSQALTLDQAQQALEAQLANTVLQLTRRADLPQNTSSIHVNPRSQPVPRTAVSHRGHGLGESLKVALHQLAIVRHKLDNVEQNLSATQSK